VRKRSEMLPWIRLVIVDEFHKASDGERGWLLETLIGWFMLLQKTYNYQIIMMSAIISNLEQSIINDNITLYQNKWSPTRKLYGLYYLPKSKRIKNVKNRIKKGQVLWEPYSLALRYQRNSEIIQSIFNKEYRGRKRADSYDPDASDTKYDLCWKAINTLNELPILVYFFTKDDINRFVDRSGKYLDKITDEQSLDDLKRTIIKKIGANHKLCKALDYGVAFHNGDLPEDVRIAIENAYRNKVIKILACTTTLADGVNLPVSTLIMGSCFNFDCTRGINNSDYKNIVGRIGRALTDTEGKIFIIKHNEYYKAETEDRILSFTKPSVLETPLISAIDKAADNIDEAFDFVESVVEGKRISQDLAIQKMIDRLQVFVFSLYEQIEAKDFESFYPEYVNCFFINTSENAKKVIKPATEAMYRVASNISSDFLHKCNSTGLSYISNKKMDEIVQRIINEFSDLDFSNELLITKEIYSQIRKRKIENTCTSRTNWGISF
jgi:superfamily II DNA/RNA helicase